MADELDDFFVEELEIPEADRDLIRAYREVGRNVDGLAYTEDFDRLYERYRQSGHAETKHEVFRRLLSLRKAGLLPRILQPSPYRPTATS